MLVDVRRADGILRTHSLRFRLGISIVYVLEVETICSTREREPYFNFFEIAGAT
jgi:hypothetical protein